VFYALNKCVLPEANEPFVRCSAKGPVLNWHKIKDWPTSQPVTPLASPIVHQPRGPLPVLLSVPHSGRDYPDWLVESASAGAPSLATLEDPHVDRLVWRALGRGCGAVIARAPRAAVDCNRAEDDIDPSVIDGARRGRVTARARGGLGIVPGRTQQYGYLWRRAIGPAELERRLDQAHRPYHQAIADQLALLRDRFGCALLIDCHSMPPPPLGVAPIVFGDCRGRTADPWVSSEAMAIARRCGFEAGLNDPFAGGHVIDRHARPALGIHALQLEIDRCCYLDSALREPGPGFQRLAEFIATLALELGNALLGRQVAMAAE
jgi:N-formylglutamate amidohydrolase